MRPPEAFRLYFNIIIGIIAIAGLFLLMQSPVSTDNLGGVATQTSEDMTNFEEVFFPFLLIIYIGVVAFLVIHIKRNKI